jgi:hypothetical protein
VTERRDRRKPSGRRYPPFFEKAVPIALVVIAVAILILLAVSIVVALNLLPGSP